MFWFEYIYFFSKFNTNTIICLFKLNLKILYIGYIESQVKYYSLTCRQTLDKVYRTDKILLIHPLLKMDILIL